ncbi:MAG TPA: phosphatidylserine/phosphatidylglycerophosphate/cardiolipin synthase family protein [Micromonosporaceae bacterium]|nr:phosphatidylserine/phosphatidylglycerophosphate/cardiolipin synthase family protein [Micromonosporaceae bacterium]
MAGIVFTAQYLVDVEKRLEVLERTFEGRLDRIEWKFDEHVTRTTVQLEEHAEVTERQITEGFSKIHLATELFSLREASQLNPDEMRHMTKLVRSSTKINSEASKLVHDFAQAEIARLANYLKQLGDGSDLTYEGEDRDWLIGLTKSVRSSLRATSLSTVDAGGRGFVDGGLWRSDLGQRYIEEQQLAIERGVRIQRIFVIDRQDFNIEDKHLQEVLESHAHIGVEVRTLDATASPAVHSKLRDIIIFDEVLSYQTTPATPMTNLNPIIVNTSLVTQPEKVKERRRLFDQLWNNPNVKVVTVDASNNLVFRPISG